MYNKKLLLNVLNDLNKTKAPARKKDIEYVSPDSVDPTLETPQMKKGGSKKFSKHLGATNRLFKKNPLFKKPNYKSKTYDPQAMYFEDGGYVEVELTPEEIEQYRKGGYIVEDISVPELNTYAEGGATCPRGYVRDASGKCVPYNFNDVQAADSYKGMYGGYDKKGVKNLKQETIVAKKGKKFSDYVLRGGKTKADMAKKLGKDAGQYFGMPGEALQPTNFTKAGLEKYTKVVKDAKKNFDAEAKNYQDYLKAKEKVATDKMDTGKYADKYNEKNWSQYDQNIAKGSGPDADYSAKEAKAEWKPEIMQDVGDYAHMAAMGALGIAGAGALSGAAGSVGNAVGKVLNNPFVSAPLSAYGVYDAATNTIPEAYRDFSEGRYLEGVGNTAMAALDLYVPGFGKGIKTGIKGLGKVAEYAKNMEPAGIGPLMLLGPSGGTNMVKKNIPYYEQLLNTYDSKVMSATNKKFYKDLISTAKKQDGMLTEAQLRELDRLKTGNFDFGKRGFNKESLVQVEPKAPGQTPKSEFKSEIDWGKWNKEIPENAPLIQEYNTIEETAKANGTWMKNPDGSQFQGTPEQFIQQQSQNFKNAFGNSKLVNPDGSPTIQYHGSAKKFDTFDESKFQLGDSGYSGKGIYTSPYKTTADSYAISSAKFHKGDIEPTVYELYGQANNPISSSQLINENKGRDLFNFHRDRNWQGELSPYESLREYDAAISDQLTGVQNIRPWHNAREVVFPTNKQLKSAIGNNGMFDMSNPNIYKAIIPTVGVTGLTGLMLANPFQGSSGLPQQKKGGITDNYIEIEIPEHEIQNYIEQGYRVEPVYDTPVMAGGGTPSELWEEYTGTPWSEAKKQGLTDGSYDKNIKLAEKLQAGQFGQPKVSKQDSTDKMVQYTSMVKQMVKQGATLDDLVRQRVGTKEGLQMMFPELISSSKKSTVTKSSAPKQTSTPKLK